jgi:hypothetical protein
VTTVRRAEIVAIALASAAVLLFETLVTRVLSVTLQYHFAFLAISLAMLGLGAPGVWFSLRPPGTTALRTSFFVAAVTIPASVLAIVKLGARWHSITLVVFALLAPLLALGSAVCVLLVRAEGSRVARMYAADLVGASIGAIGVIPLLQGIPTPPLVAALAFLPLAAIVIVGPRDRRTLVGVGMIATALCALLAWKRPFALHYTKRYVETIAPIYERWSPTARVTVLPEEALEGVDPTGFAAGLFGWGMGTRFVPTEHHELWLDQDGSAGTPIVRWSRTDPVPKFLYYDVTSTAYQIDRSLDRVAVVGAGGGRDVLTAYGAGAHAIDAIELNPYIADAVRNDFAAYSGDPYDLRGVTTIIGDGRAVLTAHHAPYDVVQISLIDTVAATAAGAYALSENGLYTVEAFRTYFRSLSPNGVLSVSRWIEGVGRLEAPRLVLIAQEALVEEGIAEPRTHMIVVKAGMVANLMLFHSPVDEQTIEKVDGVVAERGFKRLWPPVGPKPGSLIAAALVRGPDFFARRGFDVTPTTDDRPFFFQTTDLLSPPPGVVDPALVLRKIVLLLSVVTLALFFSPFLARLARRRAPRSPRLVSASAYFALIGLSFMLLEIPLVLRTTLYLGHPSRGAAVVLGALLLGAGLGALTIARASPRTMLTALASLPFVALIVALGIGPVATATLAWPLAVRVALVIAALLPLGFVMGTAFPAGMIRFDDVDRSWLWAVNGAASVLASALAIALSMVVGLAISMVIGTLGYMIIVLLWSRASRATNAPRSNCDAHR